MHFPPSPASSCVTLSLQLCRRFERLHTVFHFSCPCSNGETGFQLTVPVLSGKRRTIPVFLAAADLPAFVLLCCSCAQVMHLYQDEPQEAAFRHQFHEDKGLAVRQLSRQINSGANGHAFHFLAGRISPYPVMEVLWGFHLLKYGTGRLPYEVSR